MFDVSFWELLLVFIGFVFVPPELSKSMLKNAFNAYKSIKNEVLAIKTEISNITEDTEANHNIPFQTPPLPEGKSNEDKSYASIEQEAKLFATKQDEASKTTTGAN